MWEMGPARGRKGLEGAEASSAAPPWLGAVSCRWALSAGGAQSSLHTLVMGITQNVEARGCFHCAPAGVVRSEVRPRLPARTGTAIAHGPHGLPSQHRGGVGPFLLEPFPSQSQLPATSSRVGKETKGNPEKWREQSGALAVPLPAAARSWEGGSTSPPRQRRWPPARRQAALPWQRHEDPICLPCLQLASLSRF